MPGLPFMPFFCALLRQHRLLIVLMLLCRLAEVDGQEDPSFTVRYMGLKDGLSSRDVKDIYQDKQGLIWVATANGLNRYDGRQIKVYSNSAASAVQLPAIAVRNIAEDGAQNLLLCTDAGLIVLDPSRQRLVPARQLGFPDSIARQTNCRIERVSGGKFFLLAGSVIYLIERGQTREWYRLPPGYAQQIKGICYSNRDSTLYLRTSSLDLGLLAIRDKRLESLNYPISVHKVENGFPPAVFGKQSHGLLNCLGDTMTLLWLNADGIRLFINRAKKRFERIEGERFSQLFPPWMAVQRYLASVDEQTLPSSMRQANLRLCFKDAQGVFWLGTDLGVFLVRETRKLPFRQFDFLKTVSIRSILEDEDNCLLIGTYGGFFKYDPKNSSTKKMPDIKTVMDAVAVGDHRYWITLERYNGLRFFDSKTHLLTPFYAHAPSLSFAADFARVGNSVWMAGKINQIYCLHIPDGRTLYQTALESYHPSNSDVQVKALLPAKDGSVWIASEGGLYRLVPKNGARLVQDTASVPSALKKSKINALYEDQAGRIWVGTDGQGLALLFPGSGRLDWYTYHKDGLANDVVYSLLGSHSDSLLWIGTLNGLSRLNTNTGFFNNYYQEDGLADNEFNSGARYQAKDGSLYFGGVNGITHFDPNKFIPLANRLEASIMVERSAASGVAPFESFPENGATITIPPSENYLEIRFSSNELFEAETVRYRYVISGLYDHWQYSDAASKLVLRHLYPGRYVLKVQAITSAGHWSESYTLTIQVLPQYYQTWWFRALMVALAVGLLYGAYRFRIWQIQQEYAIRSRIVHDLHDDFGSRLYAMRAMASKIASPQTKATDLETLFAQFEATSKNAYSAMRDFIWAFDPKSDHLEDLVERMADFAENTIRPLVQELKICNKTVPRDGSIAQVAKHHTLMVYQEILTNASKHTFSESLEITFSEKNQHLQIHILNKHRGLREVNTDSGHNGQESINTRLAAIKGRLEWQETGNLQDISLLIPL